VASRDNEWVTEPLDLSYWLCASVRRAAAILLGGALLTATAAPAAAQQNLPGSVTGSSGPSKTGGDPQQSGETPREIPDEQVRDLIATLEDPARRQELVDSLQALLAVRTKAGAGEQPTPEDLMSPVVDAISSRAEVVGDAAISIADSLGEIPALAVWLQAQLRDPLQRLRWREVAIHVGVMLGAGLIAHWGVGLALRRWRRRLTHPPEGHAVWRLPRLLAWLVLLLLPLLAFVAAISVTAPLVQPSALVRSVMVLLLQGFVLAGVTAAVARMLFAPRARAIRLVRLEDDAANYAFDAGRRIARTGIYGYFGLEAARRLGLPWTIHGFLLHLVFLAVLGLAIAVVVRSRRAVAEAIPSLGGEGHSRALRPLPWRRLADVWHFLAITYLVFIYLVWALKVPGGFATLLWGTLGTVLVVVIGWGLLRLLDGLFRREPVVGEEVEGAVPLSRARAVRYLPLARTLLRTAVIVVLGIVLLEIWGFELLEWLRSDAGQTFGGKLLTIVLVGGVTLALWEVASLAIERSISDTDAEGNLRLSNRTRTLLSIARNFLLVFLSLIALFVILSELGLNIAPLLAGAGVIGLAIGFGSQKLVQDIITGMFVLLADTVRVGDVVEVAGRSGVVERVTMRTVVLRDYVGTVHTIPYSSIDTVSNSSKEFSYAQFDIGVAYRESVDQVMEVMREVGQQMSHDPYFRRLILEPLEMAGVDRFADSAVIIKARLKTRALKQWEVAREYNRRLKNRFDELGIEIPFPHQTIYFGADKQGEAPPARVLVQNAAEPKADSQPAAQSGTSAEPEPAVARAQGD
jgi:moderate conductance mechanosensitive channel